MGALKAVMAGADAVQMVSALLIHGTGAGSPRLSATMAEWLEEHEYASLAQARGSMSLLKSPNPQAFTRANYMRIPERLEGLISTLRLLKNPPGHRGFFLRCAINHRLSG
jgi:hypothetical protein